MMKIMGTGGTFVTERCKEAPWKLVDGKESPWRNSTTQNPFTGISTTITLLMIPTIYAMHSLALRTFGGQNGGLQRVFAFLNSFSEVNTYLAL